MSGLSESNDTDLDDNSLIALADVGGFKLLIIALSQIKEELQIMNLHLSKITNEEYTKKDV